MDLTLPLRPWAKANEQSEVFQMLEKLLALTDPSHQVESVFALLLETSRTGGLAFRWEAADGFREPVFYIVEPEIIPRGKLEAFSPDEVVESFVQDVIYHFVSGRLEFTVRMRPFELVFFIRRSPSDTRAKSPILITFPAFSGAQVIDAP